MWGGSTNEQYQARALLRPIGRLRPETLREVEQALAMILGLDGRGVT